MRLSLILNTYESPKALKKVLDGLSLQSVQPGEILIADDGSKKPTEDVIARWGESAKTNVRHVWHEHQGFRRTIILNRAIAQSTGDYIVFLDGDCVPHKHFIADHEALAEHGCWVQGRRCFVEERHVPAFDIKNASILAWLLTGKIKGAMKSIRWPLPQIKRDKELKGILGCNMGFWKSDLIEVNGLDEGYMGWGKEDSDLGVRMYHLGRTRKLVHGWAVEYHLNHPFAPRDRVPISEARLRETIATGKIRCELGVSRYLAPTPSTVTPT